MIAVLGLATVAIAVLVLALVRRNRADSRVLGAWRGRVEEAAADIESTRILLMQPAVASVDGEVRWHHLEDRVDKLTYELDRLATEALDESNRTVLLTVRDDLRGLRYAIEASRAAKASGEPAGPGDRAGHDVREHKAALDQSLRDLHHMTQR